MKKLFGSLFLSLGILCASHNLQAMMNEGEIPQEILDRLNELKAKKQILTPEIFDTVMKRLSNKPMGDFLVHELKPQLENFMRKLGTEISMNDWEHEVRKTYCQLLRKIAATNLPTATALRLLWNEEAVVMTLNWDMPDVPMDIMMQACNFKTN